MVCYLQFLPFTAAVGLLLTVVFHRAVDAQTPPAFIQAPVFEPAIDYESVTKIEGCTEERVRIVKYHACRDSATLYARAFADAKADGQPLMVIFGFNRCPYCTVLERAIFNPDNPVRGIHMARNFSKSQLQSYVDEGAAITIPVLRIHARSPHGLALADKLGITAMAKARGWHRVWSPFIVLINPETGAMASESEWEAKEIWCDWTVNVVKPLEDVGIFARGEPINPRERCKKRG